MQAVDVSAYLPAISPFMLQRSSPLPLYQQLARLLNQRIASGEWKPGDQIPGDHELQQVYRLSRATVRQAVQDLERAGLVTRQRGRGTFVSVPAPVHGRTGVGESLLRRGMQPGWRVVLAGPAPASPAVAERLRISPGAEVFHSLRVRLADTCPIGQLEAWVPFGLADELDLGRLAAGPSLDYLRGRGLLRRARVVRSVTAAAADPTTAANLEIPAATPVLQVVRLVLAADGRPLEHCCATYRTDRFQLALPDTIEA